MFQHSTATQKLGKLDFRVNFRKKIQELDGNTARFWGHLFTKNDHFLTGMG